MHAYIANLSIRTTNIIKRQTSKLSPAQRRTLQKFHRENFSNTNKQTHVQNFKPEASTPTQISNRNCARAEAAIWREKHHPPGKIEINDTTKRHWNTMTDHSQGRRGVFNEDDDGGWVCSMGVCTVACVRRTVSQHPAVLSAQWSVLDCRQPLCSLQLGC